MVTQILNMFDPGTSDFKKLNWMLLCMPFMFPYLTTHFILNNMISNILLLILNGLTAALKPLSNLTTPFMFVCFTILSWNISGLLPFNFTMTTQFMMTASLALPLWAAPFWNSICLKWWWPSHLTPANLPALALAMFMAWVELMSCFLRPVTLSLRLMINLTAGHLMLSLVALAQPNSMNFTYVILGLVMFMFMMLEMAVAFIQSYVFSMLTLLYSKEN